MKVYYDDEVDALYIEFSTEEPEGVSEWYKDIHLDLTGEGKLVGVEILEVSTRIDLNTILSPQFDPERMDENNPKWTEEMFLCARPAHEALSEILGVSHPAGTETKLTI